MKNTYKPLTFVLLLFLSINLYGQSGIKGIVTDKITGETLIGANVVLDSITPVLGASTQLDGDFMINVKPGTYTVRCSFVSYKTKVVTGVVVSADKYTEVNFVLDQADGTELFEIDVVESKVNNTENAVLMDIKQAKQVVVGLSKQEIAKSNYRDASEVARRIPGVTVIDNRFVMVRGLSERYNEVWVNNGTTPSVEPDVKAFSFDLIPSSAIDRFMIYKTGAPELPGNFAGGAVKIFTMDLPEKSGIQANYSVAYRPLTTFETREAMEKKSGDAFGLGESSRLMPANFPTTNILLLTPEQLQAAGRLFPNNWATSSMKSTPIDQRFGISGAWRQNYKKFQVGNVTNVTYSNTYQNLAVDMLQGNYNEATQKNDTFIFNQDNRYIQQARFGIVHNWAFKFKKNHRIEFKNLINQSGTSTVFIRNQNNVINGYKAQAMEQRYQARNIYVGQLGGAHSFNEEKTTFDWTYSFSTSHRADPDLRRLRRNLDLNDPSDSRYGKYYLPNPGQDPNIAGRFYLDLNETIHTFSLNGEHKIPMGKDKLFIPTIKFGTFVERKDREFNMRSFAFKTANIFTFDNTIPYQSVDSLFRPENINNTTGYQISESTKAADSYSAQNRLNAYYLGLNIPVTPKLNVYTGVRIEDNIQTLNSFDRVTSEIVDVIIDKTDFLPSINASYNFTEKSLVRIAYAKTLNRPEFRELAPFPFLNFDYNALYYGNDTLTNCYINSVDARWELYPGVGENLSVGGFFKEFKNPIENILIPTGGELNFSYKNAPKAISYGVEVDARKSLNTIGEKLKSQFVSNLSFVLNASYIISEVDLGDVSFQASKRPMQGQSPYIVNGGFYYQNDTINLSFSLLYNVIGPRIIFVGNDIDPDIYEMPRNVIDFTVTKGIGKYVQIRASVNDILNQPILLLQDGNLDGKLDRDNDLNVQKFRRGSYYTLGVIFRLDGKEPRKP